MATFREYQFRKVFGGSHEDFLDEPLANVEWMLAIHNLMEELRHRAGNPR